MSAARTGRLQWACEECLKAGRAIEGQPWNQTFCDYEPYLAYFDRTVTCQDCLNPFVFQAREQLYWYERLKFYVQSFPKHCLSCRRKRRAKRRAMQALQKESSQLDPQDPFQLLHMASLCLEAGYLSKASEYIARARNRARERGELEKLAVQIDILQQQIQSEITSDVGGYNSLI
ncbi:zinc-ribbon domain containing protein [Ktedonosporobacter rubrisoli]|uniref:zinc-ribbon domain containing protein n=1 Tax=Ktedonosporobacter rubrisoli TaxID=2509675 RepID=UPI0013EE8E6D|nr:zinc-ribbon domain containing protein [Ktedonosporobacter rubrisoli]